MTFHFRPAVRGTIPILMGISGATGTGKTCSALRVASGLSDRIACVDTERGRARHYADHFKFDHALLEPPYSPERYIEALSAAEDHVGPGGCVIIDSGSHEWEGVGGLLEDAQESAQQMYERAVEKAEKNGRASDWITPESFTYPSWREPKKRHQALVNRILQCQCHVIFCFRAKEKRKMMKNGNKTELTSLGVLPILEEGFPYEMTLFAMLTADSQGVPIFNSVGKPLAGAFRPIFAQHAPLSEEHGRALAAWSISEQATTRATKTHPKLMQVFDADGKATSTVPRASEWLSAYRALVAGSEERRIEVIERNLPMLRELASRFPEQFGPELEAAEALTDEGVPA